MTNDDRTNWFELAKAICARQQVCLTAAAPELLAACRHMIEVTGGSRFWNGETAEALKAIEAAIAKAEGKEVA